MSMKPLISVAGSQGVYNLAKVPTMKPLGDVKKENDVQSAAPEATPEVKK